MSSEKDDGIKKILEPYDDWGQRVEFDREEVKEIIAQAKQEALDIEVDKTEAYRKVLKHRGECKKWGREFCLECFGGGLTKYSNNLLQEAKFKAKSKVR